MSSLGKFELAYAPQLCLCASCRIPGSSPETIKAGSVARWVNYFSGNNYTNILTAKSRPIGSPSTDMVFSAAFSDLAGLHTKAEHARINNYLNIFNTLKPNESLEGREFPEDIRKVY